MTTATTSPGTRPDSIAPRDFAPVLRALLARRMRSAAGRARANPFRRLAAAIMRAAHSVSLRTDHPGILATSNTMPFGPFRLSALGLGLAGGGGGGSGRPARGTSAPHLSVRATPHLAQRPPRNAEKER